MKPLEVKAIGRGADPIKLCWLRFSDRFGSRGIPMAGMLAFTIEGIETALNGDPALWLFDQVFMRRAEKHTCN